MRHPWRTAGLVALLVVLGVLAADLARRLPFRPSREPFPPGPPGFVQEVAGLGHLVIAQRGPLVLDVEAPRESPGAEGGAASPRYRLLRLEGRDPEPDEAGNMLLQDVVLRRFAPDGAPISVTRAPRAWIPLAGGSSKLQVAMDQEWRLEQPEIVLTPGRGGRKIALDAREVLLDPRGGSARAPGPFTARSSGLVVSSSDLETDPEGNLRWQGPVSWSFPAGGGAAYRGESDAGGELRRLEEGVDLLRLPAITGARIVLPPESGLPGTLETAGLELRLSRPAEGGPPRPLEARGEAPTRFLGQDTRVEGGEALARWGEAEGRVEALELQGPLRFAQRREDGSEVLGSATGRALYRVTAATPVLEGGVVLEAPEGTLSCQRLSALPEGGWLLEGPVVLRPTTGPIHSLEAPRVLHWPGKQSLFEEGFVLAGADEEGEWTVRGRWLDVRLGPDGNPTWMEARGGVVWNRGGAIFRGERLLRRGEKETRLEGTPATGQVPLADAGGATVELEARRFLLIGEDLVLREEPRLRLPAALLGLPAGQDVEVRAGTMRWRGGERTWELTRDVRLDGGLRGGARRGLWRPEEGLTLEGPRQPAWVAGTRPDGTSFHLTGRTLRLQDRTVTVEGAAQADFRRGVEGDAWTVHADRLVLAEGGGHAEGRVQVEGGGIRGRARRARWEAPAATGGAPRLTLEEEAEIEAEEGTATGDRLAYDAAAGLLEAWGRPAMVQLAEGRTARGRHLRLHLAFRLLAGEDLVIEPGNGKP